VTAFRSSGVIGGIARLRVATDTGSKYTRYAITVTNKKGKTVAKLERPVVHPGRVQTIAWRVPAGLRAQTLRYSVVAYGPDGLSSAKASALLQIKARVSRKATPKR
jgi:hypothetical protein